MRKTGMQKAPRKKKRLTHADARKQVQEISGPKRDESKQHTNRKKDWSDTQMKLK